MSKNELKPDIVTFSKSFGGGLASISGYTSLEKVFQSLRVSKRCLITFINIFKLCRGVKISAKNT